MNFLRDLALAHQQHEGFYPGSLAYRNNNPGNLRLTAYEAAHYGATPGAGGFARFPSYTSGLLALMGDVKAKITGGSSHIDYSKHPTFLDYVKVYAPSDDGNDPGGYCRVLCRALSKYGVTPQTPLTTLAQLARDNTPLQPDPAHPQPPPAVTDPQVAVRLLRRKIAAETDPTKKQALGRELQRLLSRITPNTP